MDGLYESIGGVRLIYITFLLSVSLPLVWSQDKPKEVDVRKGHGFSRRLAMLDTEREEYASHLASFVANQLARSKGNAAMAENAQRVLHVARLLSPRNKRAVVVDFQVRKGVVPEAVPGTFSSVALAKLLLTRGQLLLQQPGEENEWLGRVFVRFAAELDPKNEDAVYASEIDQMEKGPLNWNYPDKEEKRPQKPPQDEVIVE